jgi:membrane protease YdiL (CAAX protease family)
MQIAKWQVLVADILMIIFVIIFPHIGILPMFAYPIFVLLVVWAYLKIYKQNFSSVGFRFRDISVKSFLYGALTGLTYAAFAYWLLDPLIGKLGFKPANLGDFDSLRHHFFNYLFLMVLAWILVIPYEEIIFRGFILTRIKNWFGNSKQAFAVSALITSALFAFYHYQEGMGAVLQIFIFALFQVGLYKKFKGNLWYLIFFHAWYDSFMLTAIYLGLM